MKVPFFCCFRFPSLSFFLWGHGNRASCPWPLRHSSASGESSLRSDGFFCLLLVVPPCVISDSVRWGQTCHHGFCVFGQGARVCLDSDVWISLFPSVCSFFPPPPPCFGLTPAAGPTVSLFFFPKGEFPLWTFFFPLLPLLFSFFWDLKVAADVSLASGMGRFF